jgi:alkyl sulfatase BDS1-like metallo-beta-lactamase superfamily hydrolase
MRRVLLLSISCVSICTLHCSQRPGRSDEWTTPELLVASAAAAEQPSLTAKEATEATKRVNATHFAALPFRIAGISTARLSDSTLNYRGDRSEATALFGTLDGFEPRFNIVTP